MLVPPPKVILGLDDATDRARPDGETYLALLALDLHDKAAILEFVNTYGLLRGGEAYSDVNGWARFVRKLSPRREQVRKRDALRRHLATATDRRATAALRALDIEGDLQELLVIHDYTESLAEFLFAAGVLRDAAQAWRVLREELDPRMFHWFSSTRDEPVDSTHDVMGLLHSILPHLLSHFGPNIEIRTTFPENWPRGAKGVEQMFTAKLSPPEVTHAAGPSCAPLYQICALELYNHIAENAEYRICANETCRKLFVHQSGTAQYGQYRSKGVLYCSNLCARAQAQRQLRRRQAAAKADRS